MPRGYSAQRRRRASRGTLSLRAASPESLARSAILARSVAREPRADAILGPGSSVGCRVPSAVRRVLVELAGPVQIVAPGIGNRPQGDADRHRRDPVGLRRVTQQGHARFARRAAPLLAVAEVAARHDVGPLGHPALRPRNHVIARTLADRRLLPAVLALVVVAGVDVDARELDRAGMATERAQEAHHRGNLDDEVHRSDVAVILFEDFNLAEEQQADGPLP